MQRFARESAERARQWRFHAHQQIERDGDELVVRFYSGGLREIAEHLFTWGCGVRIEGPAELREVMRERLRLAAQAIDN